MKKFNIHFKRLYCLVLVFVVLLGAISLTLPAGDDLVLDKGSSLAYTPNKSEISAITPENQTYTRVSISEFYNADSNGAYTSVKTSNVPTISATTIITIKNELELYAFSMICDDATAYLAYSYELLDNITYNSVYPFFPVGWSTDNPFSGTFNGNGYEISDLYFVSLSSTMETDYADMNYVSMFSNNTGTVKNLGLVDTENVQTYRINNVEGASPLIGLNTGTVTDVYAIDLRSVEEEAGLTIAGGYSISGLICANGSGGTITNAYVAYSIIVNFTVTDWIDFRPILTSNSGTISNLYFYDGSLADVETVSGGIVYTYADYVGVTIDTSTSGVNLLGTYKSSLNALIETFEVIDGWYTPLSYQVSASVLGVSTSIPFEYPTLKGLALDSSDTTGHTLLISSAKDYSFMYELMNADSYFASKYLTYKITTNIDLSTIPTHVYQYDDFFSANITSSPVTGNSQIVTLANGQKSTNPTIYNFSIMNYIDYTGYRYFGLFPLFDGSITGVNLYPNAAISDFDVNTSLSSSTTAIGVLSGFAEEATIDDVSVYCNMTLSTLDASTDDFGRYIVGGLVGVASRSTSITNCSSAGSINGGTHTSTTLQSPSNGYAPGNSLGGLIGYTVANVSTITACISSINLTATIYSSSITANQYIGGIIGAGYTSSFSEMANKGTITIGTSSSDYYGTVYAAGIIGRHIGVSNSISSLHNQGNITYYVRSVAKTAYLSGVINEDILTAASGTLTKSTLTTLTASGLSNSCDIAITNSLTMTATLADSMNLNVAGVAFINAANGFTSNLSGIYNLKYTFTNTFGKTAITNNVAVDISVVREYAPCVVSNATSSTGLVTISKVYNFRSIDFTQSVDSYFTNVNYSGCLSGEYMTISDARNEGALNFTLLKNASRALAYATGYLKSFKIYGVFEEVSTGCTASTIYNAGDISFYIGDSSVSNNNVYYDLYIAGICYANRNQFASDVAYASYNPLDEDYDSDKTGSLNTVINNGDISLNSYSLQYGITYYTSTGTTYKNQISSITNGLLRGSSRLAGICMVNEAVISEAYNLGNVDNHNYLATPTGNYSNSLGYFSMESAGITWANLGEYAQIRDSANNGRIRTINMSGMDDSTSFVYSSGISVRNDVYEDASTYGGTNNSHHTQLICFTINYAEIIAFNYTANITSVSNAPHSVASGILSTGLCNVLNAVNYGNILSQELSSGIFGYVQFYQYADEVTSTSKVTIANVINYGNVRAISWFKTVDGSPERIPYSEIIEINNDSSAVYVTNCQVAYQQYGGAAIGIISYASTSGGSTAAANATNISVRYLINFYTGSPVVGVENATPTNATNSNSTLFTTKENDSFMGQAVTYAPLSNISDEDGNIGVFSSNFAFRLAIEGNTAIVETTDNYLSDYFSFVAFTKINESLLESIGWRALAYSDAANNFAKDLDAIGTLMTTYSTINSANYATLVTAALATENWVSNCDTQVLSTILDSILADQEITDLRNIVEYLFFTSDSRSSITKTLRESVVNTLLIDQNYTKADLVTLLDGLLYDDLIADIVSNDDTEYAELKELISTNLENLELQDLIDLSNDYIAYLNDSNNTYFTSLFSNTATVQVREEALVQLLRGLDADIYTELVELIDDSEGASVSAQMNYALATLTDTEKASLYTSLIANNTFAGDSVGIEEAITKALKKMHISDYSITTAMATAFNTNLTANLSDSISTTAYDINNDGTATDATSTITSLGYTLTADDYTSAWNYIKNDSGMSTYLSSILSSVKDRNNVSHPGIYALATEFCNTYQSNDSPSGISYAYSNERTGRATAVGEAMKTRFIFTPDDICADGSGGGLTYYYGPYVNATNTMYEATVSDSHISGGASGIDSYLFDNSGTDTTQTYVPVFISLDCGYLENKGLVLATASNSYRADIYKFIWNNVNSSGSGAGDSNAQWVSEQIIDGQKADNQAVLLINNVSANYTSNSSTYKTGLTTPYTDFSVATTYKKTDGTPYYFDFDTAGKTTTTFERGLSNTTVNSSYSDGIVSVSGSGTISTYNSSYLFSYVTSDYITGIYYQRDQWGTNGAYLTAKTDNTTTSIGVLTTSFIDYTVEDLIALDGVYTKGRSVGTVQALDEVRIINILMQKILSTDAGRQYVLGIVAANAQEDFAEEAYSTVKAMMTAMSGSTAFVAQFLKNAVYDNDAHSLTSLNSSTYQVYLLGLISGVQFSDYEEIILNSIENRSNYNIVVQYLLNADAGYYQYQSGSGLYEWLNEYEYSNLSYLVNYLRNCGLDDTVITTILTNADPDNITDYISSVPQDNATADSLISGGFTLGTGFAGNVDYQTLSGNEYNYNVTANSASSTISFTVPSGYTNATLNVVAKGASGTLTTNSTTKNTSASLASYSFTGLTADTYSLAVSNGVSIYDLELTDGVITTDPVTLPLDGSSGNAGNITYGTGVTYTNSYLSVNNNRTVSYVASNAGTLTVSVNLGTITASGSVSGALTATTNGNDSIYQIAAETVTITATSATQITAMTFTLPGTEVLLTDNMNVVGNKIATNSVNYLTGYSSFSSNALDLYVLSGLSEAKNKIFNANEITDGTYTSSNTTNPNFTINATSDYNVSVGSNSATIDSQSYTKAVVFGGIGNSTYRNISFSASEASTVYVYAKASSSNTRLALSDGTNTYSHSITTSGDVAIFKISPNASTNYYLYNTLDTSVSIYKIVVVSSTNLSTYYSTHYPDYANIPTNILDTFDEYSDFINLYDKDATLDDTTLRTYTGAYNFLASSNLEETSLISFNVSSGTPNLSVTATGTGTLTLRSVANNVTTIIGSVDLSAEGYSGTATWQSLANGNYELVVIDNCIITGLTLGSTTMTINSDGITNSNVFTLTNLRTHSSVNKDDLVLFVSTFFGTDVEKLGNVMSEDDLKTLIKGIASKDDIALTSFISGCDNSSTLSNVIATLCKQESSFIPEVIGLANVENLSSEQELMFLSAYIGTDFLNYKNTDLMTDSILYSVLDELETSASITYDHQFITSDTEIDNDDFIALMQVLGFNLSTEGYGIYAVSSSEGILNGNFLPDNIDFDEFDPYYTYNSALNTYEPSDTQDSTWRGGVTTTDGVTSPNTTNEDSVNYGFFVSMKQLKLSIATTIFNIELVSIDGNYTLTTPSDAIDLENSTITFYVGSNYGSGLLGATYGINTTAGAYELSYGATLGANKTNTLTVGGNTTLTVIAEDTSVTKNYTIKIVQTVATTLEIASVKANDGTADTTRDFSSNSLDISNVGALQVNSSGGSLELVLDTTNVPNSTDLKPMITLDNGTTGFSFAEIDNNGIVSTTSSNFNSSTNSWGAGSVTINLDIDNDLAYGSHTIRITLSNSLVYSITFSKIISTDVSLTEVVFDNTTYNFTSDSATTYILFGRTFTYSSIAGTYTAGSHPAYISSWDINPLATVEVTVSRGIAGDDSSATTTDGVTTYKNGIMTYTITYSVTAEDGTTTATYTHLLIEEDPFAAAKDDGAFITTNYDYNDYVACYKDGDLVTDLAPNTSGEITVSFERGYQPKYRFMYNFDGFYTGSHDITSFLSVSCSNADTSYYNAEVKYYGFSVNFFDNAEPDDYVLNLSYTSSSTAWSGTDTYVRVFESADVTVSKLKSTDSYLKRITFIEGASKISNLATVGAIDVIYPESGYTNVDDDSLIYGDLYANPSNCAVYSPSNGNIVHSTAAQAVNNYYIVGTVSNASLESYAPTFKIEEHASIYQFKTLANNSILYYCEYKTTVTGATVYQTFLVSSDWTTAYPTDSFDGSTVPDESYTITNGTFTANGYTYTKSEYAGTTSSSNTGLIMDYIGTPGENEFYYISYRIFSESDTLTNPTNYRDYNIAILDLTNTVSYTITIIDDSTDHSLQSVAESIYFTIVCYDPKRNGTSIDTNAPDITDTINGTISAFANLDADSDAYYVTNTLQTLPYGYYYFEVDLPSGYGCEYMVTTSGKSNTGNQLSDLLENGNLKYPGDDSYLPPTSIVAQKIDVAIRVFDSDEYNFAWGERVLDVVQRVASNATSTTTSTITFNTDGGSNIAAITGLVYSNIDVANPTKSGYTFAGWTILDGEEYVPYTLKYMPESNITLKASWAANE